MEKPIYSLKESHIDSNGKNILTIKVSDAPRGFFNISASELIKNRKDLLKNFDVNDIINIMGLATTENHTSVVQESKFGHFKFLPFLSMLFVVGFVTSNIGSSKLMSVMGITMTGGIIAFPLSYIIGDIITEVYGYKRSRQLIWGAIISNILMILILEVTIHADPSPFWHNQEAYHTILGSVPRIVAASLISYAFGEFINSYILAKMKLSSKQPLIMRLIASSLLGIVTDSLIFVAISYAGELPLLSLIFLGFKVYVIKTVLEIILMFFTMKIIEYIKEKEEMDIVDINTNFTPFSFDLSYTEINNHTRH